MLAPSQPSVSVGEHGLGSPERIAVNRQATTPALTPSPPVRRATDTDVLLRGFESTGEGELAAPKPSEVSRREGRGLRSALFRWLPAIMFLGTIALGVVGLWLAGLVVPRRSGLGRPADGVGVPTANLRSSVATGADPAALRTVSGVAPVSESVHEAKASPVVVPGSVPSLVAPPRSSSPPAPPPPPATPVRRAVAPAASGTEDASWPLKGPIANGGAIAVRKGSAPKASASAPGPLKAAPPAGRRPRTLRARAVTRRDKVEMTVPMSEPRWRPRPILSTCRTWTCRRRTLQIRRWRGSAISPTEKGSATRFRATPSLMIEATTATHPPPSPTRNDSARRVCSPVCGARSRDLRPTHEARESNGGAGVTYAARPHPVPRPAPAIQVAPKVVVASSEADRVLAAQRAAPTVELDLPAIARPTAARNALVGLAALGIVGLTIAVCVRSLAPSSSTLAKGADAELPTIAPPLRALSGSAELSLSPSTASVPLEPAKLPSTERKAKPPAVNRALEAHPVRPTKRAATPPPSASNATRAPATEEPWYEPDPR